MEGYFVDGQLNGNGKITDADGTIMEGYFVDNKPNGVTKITVTDGSVAEVDVVDGSLNGMCKIIDVDGSVMEERYYVDNEPVFTFGKLIFEEDRPTKSKKK